MVGDLAVADAHHVDSLKVNLAVSWSDAEEISFMCSVVCLVSDHAVAIGELPNGSLDESRGKPHAYSCIACAHPFCRASCLAEACDRRNRPRIALRKHQIVLFLEPLRYSAAPQLSQHLMLSGFSYEETVCVRCFARAIGWLYFSKQHA